MTGSEWEEGKGEGEEKERRCVRDGLGGWEVTECIGVGDPQKSAKVSKFEAGRGRPHESGTALMSKQWAMCDDQLVRLASPPRISIHKARQRVQRDSSQPQTQASPKHSSPKRLTSPVETSLRSPRWK